MASDGNPVKIPAASLVHGSQAQIPLSIQERGGRNLPPDGKIAAIPAASAALVRSAATAASASQASSAAQTAARTAAQVSRAPSTEDLVAQLNKHLNVSGRADQYRVDPSSNNKVIQQINPATGDVIGEFLVSEFPALAKSVGVSGVLIDQRA